MYQNVFTLLALFSIQLSAQEAKENKAEAQSTAAKDQRQAKIDQRQAQIDQRQAVIDQKQAKVDYELAMLDQGIFLTPSDIKSMNVETNKLEIRGTRNGKDVTVTVDGPNENTTLKGNIIELKGLYGQKNNPLIVIDGVTTLFFSLSTRHE